MWRLLCSVLERVWASCRFSVSEEPLHLPCQWEAVLVVALRDIHLPLGEQLERVFLFQVVVQVTLLENGLILFFVFLLA